MCVQIHTLFVLFKSYEYISHSKNEIGKITQWLRVLAALPEVLSSIPSNHMVTYNQPSVVGFGALFWPKGIQADRALMYNKRNK